MTADAMPAEDSPAGADGFAGLHARLSGWFPFRKFRNGNNAGGTVAPL